MVVKPFPRSWEWLYLRFSAAPAPVKISLKRLEKAPSAWWAASRAALGFWATEKSSEPPSQFRSKKSREGLAGFRPRSPFAPAENTAETRESLAPLSSYLGQVSLQISREKAGSVKG